MVNLEWVLDTNIVIYILKIIFISLCTYYTNIRILNIKSKLSRINKLLLVISTILIAILANLISEISTTNIISMIYIISVDSMFFTIITKNKYGYSILITTISLSINQILFFCASSITFVLYASLYIVNEFVNFIVIVVVHILILSCFLKLKRIKNGFHFLRRNKDNQYFDILMLNISIVVLFTVIILSNYRETITINLILGLIIISIMMFVTIQKSLELYYKQRMLVKDLEETKKELEDKKAEVKELEKENLNFSKISHTIAHRQKSLEHKLEELNMNNEISNELGTRIEYVTKDLRKETPVELSKTGIEVIDDMLSYMQSECIKNKIDFQLQINGNIYTMTNHYIGKDELEILLADHIKDAIIAIGYADTVNKSILVRLGKINGIYSLYIYDSGIEFEIDTFKELGIKPSTTHKDNGGTGMGFMNTFDTLRKYKASLEIKEIGKPCKDNFTKVLKFKFDNKNEFKIKSYRKDEIKKKDKENKLNLI